MVTVIESTLWLSAFRQSFIHLLRDAFFIITHKSIMPRVCLIQEIECNKLAEGEKWTEKKTTAEQQNNINTSHEDLARAVHHHSQ